MKPRIFYRAWLSRCARRQLQSVSKRVWCCAYLLTMPASIRFTLEELSEDRNSAGPPAFVCPHTQLLIEFQMHTIHVCREPRASLHKLEKEYR